MRVRLAGAFESLSAQLDLTAWIKLLRGFGLSIVWGCYIVLSAAGYQLTVTATGKELALIATSVASHAQIVGAIQHVPPMGEYPKPEGSPDGKDPAARMLGGFIEGLRMPDGVEVSLHALRPSHGSFADAGRPDAAPRFISTYRLDVLSAHAVSPGGRIGAVATISRGDALAGWLRVTIVAGAILMVLSVSLWLFTGWFARQLDERRRREVALLAAKTEAEMANSAKTDFLAVMSHELRTPLNAIIGFSEIMKTGLFGPLGNERYTEYADNICDSGTHLLALINDILDMSRIGAGQLSLFRDVVDVRAVASECLQMLAPRAEKGGVTLHLTCEDPGPQGWLDSKRLRQIILNLLSNAVKFTPEGGEVRISIACEGDSLIVSVADTGIGMAPEDVPKALERFVQVDNALSRKYEGAGLGLPLTKRLVELHGGNFAIRSARGVGTTAIVTLPHVVIHSKEAAA